MIVAPDASPFAHILALSDRFGTLEHADGDRPRPTHGYCLDDVARVLLVTVREPNPSSELRDLARASLRFIADAQGVTGTFRNRKDAGGRWRGKRGVEDCWGRSLWALGVAAGRGEPWLRQDAKALFQHGCEQRSPHLRSMAFAALGAGSMLALDPDDRPARRLLEDALALLGWLLERETRDGHLSVTPAGGAGPGDVGPGFAQQPIEVATMAEACARAFRVTGDPMWADGVRMAAAWFDGDNDLGAPMWDPATGGSFDGLEASGPNRNQGAESSLALLATRQHARLLAPVPG